MNFIEIERLTKNTEWSMTDLHSHSHYELYFLLSGEREYFIGNRMYKIAAPCAVIIPPYTLHKSEGDKFMRMNINVAVDFLSDEEKIVIGGLANKFIDLNNEKGKKTLELLYDAESLYARGGSSDALGCFLGCMIYYLNEIKTEEISPAIIGAQKVSPLALKLIDYINTHFTERITLDDLSREFYLSKVSLCAKFKKAMNATIADYILKLRINRAKEYLMSTKKQMEEIALLSGFSSAEYMGLIFKEKTGLSPMQYRKLQNGKQ